MNTLFDTTAEIFLCIGNVLKSFLMGLCLVMTFAFVISVFVIAVPVLLLFAAIAGILELIIDDD